MSGLRVQGQEVAEGGGVGGLEPNLTAPAPAVDIRPQHPRPCRGFCRRSSRLYPQAGRWTCLWASVVGKSFLVGV